jgi:hypothetical protein
VRKAAILYGMRYADVVDEKLLLSSINLMKSKQMITNLNSRKSILVG